MSFLILALGLARLATALPSSSLESRQTGNMLGMSGGSDPSFPYPVDNDLQEGGSVVKVRYGPYNVSAKSEIDPYLLTMKKPCETCWVTAMQGGLEYADGRIANADSGAWLHHMQLDRLGAGKQDLVCGGHPNLEGMGERIYSVGNEREVSRMNAKAKYGILLREADKLIAFPELMNESQNPISVYIIIKYETIPLNSTQAQGYKEVKMAWLDITQCGYSEAPAVKGVYERKQTPGWTSKIEGKLLYATGHVHDGGTHTAIYRRRNGKVKNLCESHSRYGGRPGYTGLDGMEHISAVSFCDFSSDDSLKVGDVFYVGAFYNTTAHMLMEAPGKNKKLEPIMGISRIYIGT